MKNQILRFNEIDSTQEEAKRCCSKYDEGTVIVALEQKAGRWRLNNSWYSPPGGLYFSIILKPDLDVSNVLLLTHLTAEVAVKVLSYYGVEPKIKLPNDVLVGSNKICGILVEKSSKALIVGVGINLNILKFPEELNATSILALTGNKTDPELVLTKFLDIFNEEYSKFIKSGV